MKRTAGAYLLAIVLVATSAPALEDRWKNQIVFPDEDFRNTQTGVNFAQPRWVKFAILADDPETVYFQDCREYLFHYDFAAANLAPFVGMTSAQFDAVTLNAQGQQAILGAVLYAPYKWQLPADKQIAEYGIQFVRRDAYSREKIVDLYRLIVSRITADNSARSFYFPTYEQQPTAETHRAFLEANGVEISSTARWEEGNVLYSNGWAIGQLKYFAGREIENAYLQGQLLPTDILLTDGVPAEIPYVAGLLSLEPSTPNSHVAILANTYSIPFAYLAIVADAQRAQTLIGRRVLLRVYLDDYYYTPDSSVRLTDVTDTLDDAQVAELLEMKVPPSLAITPMATLGAYSASTEGLLPADIQYFGGKAANFGILRAAIPNNSPVAAAFSFDLWNAFLDQTPGGSTPTLTLRQTIAARLAPHSGDYPPADLAALAADLDAIQDLFRDTARTTFTAPLRDAVFATLQDPKYNFDPMRKIRFRSSTNVEDSAQFTGAGLYDSYSGLLADDLGLTTTPLALQRGVFRAIRKVFASFYNDNAYLERLRHGLDESQVGMALLVHHSYPDEIELANGVATLAKSGYPNYNLDLVAQKGAISVSNPDDGSIPEEVRVSIYEEPPRTYLNLERVSSLALLGATVLEWEKEYEDLSWLIVDIAKEYARVTKSSNFVLDLEYKKTAPDNKLVIKQVRRVPRPGDKPTITPFLLNDPADYCLYQGEVGMNRDLLARHRLKSRWRFEAKNIWLTSATLKSSILGPTRVEYTDRAYVRSITGTPSYWARFTHDAQPSQSDNMWDTTDSWRFPFLPNPRYYTIAINRIPDRVAPSESPILSLTDFNWGAYMDLRVDYDRPVLSLDNDGLETTTKSDWAQLYPAPQVLEGDMLQKRAYKDLKSGVDIKTAFCWPPNPTGPTAGYTAPCSRFVETTIKGFTTEPVVLRGYYSQTYGPGHHNFWETFIFEPRLEPGVSPQALAELEAQDIRLLMLNVGWQDGVRTFGYDPKEAKGYQTPSMYIY